MLKKLLAVLLALFAAAAFAAVDVNKASQAELESVKGIGPAISGKIIEERTKSPFKDWNDMVERVKGVGDKNAAKFSTGGLTVNGAAFAGAAAAAAPAAKKAAPAAVATTAATTAATPASAPLTADEKKAAKAKAKEDKAAAKAAAKAASAPASGAKK